MHFANSKQKRSISLIPKNTFPLDFIFLIATSKLSVKGV